MKFQGKTAVITGSGTGIGLAIAKKFAENGASLIILGRRREPLEAAAQELQAIMRKSNNLDGATVRVFSGVDVADEKTVNGMFDQLEADGVEIDYMINNAGVSGPVKCFVSAPIDDFRSTIHIHLTGTFWGSVQALRVMRRGGKIITISTFFTEERPLEQRPYRFRSPYTASQGAKNRLAELLSWELVGTGITSIATNPGPVHSDRIYKTVYPKAAAEFMRVSGFEEMTPSEVADASADLLPLLGEDPGTISNGIKAVAARVAAGKEEDTTPEAVASRLTGLLEKIQTIAEKVQKNTSRMIANQEFLSQAQVAESVLNLCDDSISAILDGKVVPGDRVFYPVKPHVGGAPLLPPSFKAEPDLAGSTILLAVDPSDDTADTEKIEYMINHIRKDCGAKVVCFISKSTPDGTAKSISNLVHSHVIDLSDPDEVSRWFNTAQAKMGKVAGLVHITGRLPDILEMAKVSRSEWNELVEKFITRPAITTQKALDLFVPGGGEDPRLFKDSDGVVMIVGPELPSGRKVTGAKRAQTEVFRGALRPFTATVNQELGDVLGSNIRVFTALPGSVTGAAADPQKIVDLFDLLLMSGEPVSSLSTVIFCTDEARR